MTAPPQKLRGCGNNWLHKGHYTAPGQAQVTLLLICECGMHMHMNAWVCILCHKPFTVTQILQLKVYFVLACAREIQRLIGTQRQKCTSDLWIAFIRATQMIV